MKLKQKAKNTLGKLSGFDKKRFFFMFVTIGMMITQLTIAVSAETGGGTSEFIESMVDILGTLLILIGGGLGIWGVVNLLEGYGNDNAGAKSQGMKQLMAGVGIALVGVVGITALKDYIGELDW